MRKYNNTQNKIEKLETSYSSQEYQVKFLNRKYINLENTIDIMQDSNKELRSDIRSIQKYHEHMIINFNNLKEECSCIKKDYEDIQENMHDAFQHELKIFEIQLNELQESLSRFRNEVSLLQRDLKDDISRLSAK